MKTLFSAVPIFGALFFASVTVSSGDEGKEKEGKRIPIEFSEQIKSDVKGLGTKGYTPLPKEVPFIKKITEQPVLYWGGADSDAVKSGRMVASEKYKLTDQKGQYVGWFGIVRKITRNKDGGAALLVEHKYFDGLTDLHIQIVSIYGAGDFKIEIPKFDAAIPLLDLVRVYGKVSIGKDGVPVVTPEYMRVWDWGLFSFMDYGVDHSNPKWVALRNVSGMDAYSPRPTAKFYEDRLGKRGK